MKRLAAMTVLALAALTATPAGASVDGCTAAIERFQTEHAAAYQDAGAPPITCAATSNGTLGGIYKQGSITIYPAHGTATADDYYRSVVAHEVGHAYNTNLGKARWNAYTIIRGWDGYTIDAYEDYAETFALTLGEWAAIGSPEPFAFQNAAGVPTAEQIAQLRQWGIVP